MLNQNSFKFTRQNTKPHEIIGTREDFVEQAVNKVIKESSSK